MGGRGGKKKRAKWNRKRKAEERERKAGAQQRWEAKGRDRRGTEYKSMIQSNARMEAYYAIQGLHSVRLDGDGAKFVPCTTDAEKEAERRKWITCLKTILPASFRLGTDLPDALRDKLEGDLDEFTGKEIEIEIDLDDEERRGWHDPEAASAAAAATSASAAASAESKAETTDEKGDESVPIKPKTRIKKVAPASKIEYIPHGYQLSVDRRTVKRNAGLAGLHDWLKVQTAAGFLTRQETVSMIPPIVLAAEPGHAVLDMCAAPGSKTSQLLEVVSQMPREDMLEPEGYVVANDSDPKRAYMLVHQLRRINSPSAFVTSIEAQIFPNLVKGEAGVGEEGMFDRVLCDVPCSGDGTTRKNPGMWKTWSQLGALALHPLQLRIALNGCRLTKVGGYMCYSTCSMNPVENEAVVAEILREADGAVELVEKRCDMPGLKARPGWTNWKVLREDRSSSQSRKQRENQKKKNNEKMQQRKKEWEEKNREKGEEDVSVTTAQDEVEETLAETSENIDVAMADETGAKEASSIDGHGAPDSAASSATNRPASRAFKPPESWDDEALVDLAKSCGLVLHDNFESVPEEWRKRVRQTVFPPSPEEAATMNLDKCIRCLPQDMDTGGFFVALFKKVAPMRARLRKSEVEEAVALDGVASVDEPDHKRRKTRDRSSAPAGAGDESLAGSTSAVESAVEPENESGVEGRTSPCGKNGEGDKQQRSNGGGRNRNWDLGNSDFVAPDPDKFPPLVEYYGFSENFPMDQIMARSNGDAKILVFMSRAIKENLIDQGLQDKVTVINSGLKAFERNNKRECDVEYRVTQEAIHFIAPHMTKRIIVAKASDFVRCIGPGSIRLSHSSTEFADAAKVLSSGSFVVALEGYERNVAAKMFLVMWKCRGEAMNCLVNKSEMDGMKSKLTGLGIDVSILEASEETKEISGKEVEDYNMEKKQEDESNSG
mmetsp:Transcript_17586/g.38220  ORF Transcript_17586/g.38220 Transcript_17586/m.38220 type:complete len:946 (+) Transcript_17586:112-2949(+)